MKSVLCSLFICVFMASGVFAEGNLLFEYSLQTDENTVCVDDERIFTSYGETMYVTGAETGNVYLRTSPSASEYYCLLSNGTMVNSVGYTKVNGVGYNQVYYNGICGWITTKYLSYYSLPAMSYYYRHVIRYAESGSVYIWNSA